MVTMIRKIENEQSGKNLSTLSDIVKRRKRGAYIGTIGRKKHVGKIKET